MADTGSFLKLFDVNVNGIPVQERNNNEVKEYEHSVEVSQVPDTFPCGHILCHNCVRKYISPLKDPSWSCPVCEKPFPRLAVHSKTDNATYGSDDLNEVDLLCNFDKLVNRFSETRYNLSRLKHENIKARSVGMTYARCCCDMCDENHGTLKVVQDYSELGVQQIRPSVTHRFFYSWINSEIITTYNSTVNSACVCIPCTTREIHENYQKISGINGNLALEVPKTYEKAVSQIGKLLTSTQIPITSLLGKNVIEIDHQISVRERSRDYNFPETVKSIQNMVKTQEKNLISYARKQIEDTGKIYHIKESSSTECCKGETIV